jgi:hypothetical protein
MKTPYLMPPICAKYGTVGREDIAIIPELLKD